MAEYELDNTKIKNMVREIVEDDEKAKKYGFEMLHSIDIQCVRVKGKVSKAYADVRKISFPTSLFTDKKWLISFYDIFDDLTEDKQKIVALHELLHIDAEKEKLVKHNIEDFRVILEEYGINWEFDK